jgi:hypothetical protein
MQPETAPDKTRGIYDKFIVRRSDGSSEHGGKHEHCRYFVLDLEHDRFAFSALQRYAQACRREYPALADDISTILLSMRKGHGDDDRLLPRL